MIEDILKAYDEAVKIDPKPFEYPEWVERELREAEEEARRRRMVHISLWGLAICFSLSGLDLLDRARARLKDRKNSSNY